MCESDKNMVYERWNACSEKLKSQSSTNNQFEVRREEHTTQHNKGIQFLSECD